MSDAVLTQRKFGTFVGVFLPMITSFLSTVFFLRLGWIVAAAGPLISTSVILLSTLIILITTFSVATAASNQEVGQGGVFAVLSRTFGIEAGCAIALPLMLAQSMSIAFCISGFVETLTLFLPLADSRWLTLGILAILTLIAGISSEITLKVQGVVFGLIVLAVTSLAFVKPFDGSMSDSISPSIPFWQALGLFFPAVTGIEVGLSLAGDLRTPARSIPLGILLALTLSLSLYLLAVFFFPIWVPLPLLLTTPFILGKIAPLPSLVLLAGWGAILSCALSALLSAPRLLEAFSTHGIIPKWIRKRWALVSIAAMAGAALWVSKIDAIAPLLTLFFFLAYGMINTAITLESFIDNPSFRPVFKTPWPLSLFGAALCFVFALMLSPGGTLTAVILITTLYLGLKKRALSSSRFDDMRRSILIFLARFAIYRLEHLKVTPKTWRLNLLVSVNDPEEEAPLIAFAGALTHNKGFLSFASVVPKEKEAHSQKLVSHLRAASIPALIEVKEGERSSEIPPLINTYGFGALLPNTILLGDRDIPFLGELAPLCYRQKKNLILLRGRSLEIRLKTKEHRHYCKIIDVWWGGLSKKNSELTLILAHMLQTSQAWKNTRIHLKSILTPDTSKDCILQELGRLAQSARLDITPQLIERATDDDLFQDTISMHSKNADLIFLGLRPPLPKETRDAYALYCQTLMDKTETLPSHVFVLAAEEVDFSQILK